MPLTYSLNMLEDDPGQREVYERYGIAMYQAQVLEHLITQTLAVAKTAAREFRTRDEVARDYDSNYTKTLGTLIGLLRPYIEDSGLEDELRAALETRNRLAHHFFWEHDGHLETIEGQSLMEEDAYDAQVQFQAVVMKLYPVMGRFLDAIGIAPDEHLEGLGAAIQEQMRLHPEQASED